MSKAFWPELKIESLIELVKLVPGLLVRVMSSAEGGEVTKAVLKSLSETHAEAPILVAQLRDLTIELPGIGDTERIAAADFIDHCHMRMADEGIANELYASLAMGWTAVANGISLPVTFDIPISVLKAAFGAGAQITVPNGKKAPKIVSLTIPSDPHDPTETFLRYLVYTCTKDVPNTVTKSEENEYRYQRFKLDLQAIRDQDRIQSAFKKTLSSVKGFTESLAKSLDSSAQSIDKKSADLKESTEKQIDRVFGSIPLKKPWAERRPFVWILNGVAKYRNRKNRGKVDVTT